MDWWNISVFGIIPVLRLYLFDKSEIKNKKYRSMPYEEKFAYYQHNSRFAFFDIILISN